MKTLLAIAITVLSHAQVQRFLPTSQVVKIATMAAHDEGYNPDAKNVFLDVLRTKEGKEPYEGYASIGLYQDDHLVRTYAIRIDTGDIADPTTCTVFRYPDLLRYKAELERGFGTKEVPVDQIASELGCDRLRLLTRPAQ